MLYINIAADFAAAGFAIFSMIAFATTYIAFATFFATNMVTDDIFATFIAL